ncbi:BQ2448_2556 [Microbotryum intermedium]|uniref:BQ2448_2556 protein n=1 Tax=Microbotryum intermedium TaxID=269621 RepID=A0A238FEM8_9BASI|nr:BQ2448_2556 [Microbotryum intermedium]
MGRQGVAPEDDDDEDVDVKLSIGGSAANRNNGAKEAKGGASEFVKKLYRWLRESRVADARPRVPVIEPLPISARSTPYLSCVATSCAMLEDPSFSAIVAWSYAGDSFVVKDMNKFTCDILPMHFKHSNFASFVRQLNKYDFHKVKNPEEGAGQYGEHTWEFKHPNFRADMKDSLNRIKRKAPTVRKGAGAASSSAAGGRRLAGDDSPAPEGGKGTTGSAADMNAIHQRLDQLHRSHSNMQQHMDNLSQDYRAVIGEMMNFQRNMVAQDQLMQNLIQYLINLEADQSAANNGGQDRNIPFIPSMQAKKLISSYTEVARASYDQMTDLSRRASLSGSNFPPIPLPPPEFGQLDVPGSKELRRDDGSGDSRDGRNQQGRAGPSQASHAPQSRPSPQGQQAQSSTQSKAQQQQQQAGSTVKQASAASSSEAQTARKLAYVPGWAVPPRVLLVEDDAVCRKLSSKFLEVFGCQIDVAVDGVSAVNKMNMQKYDLVLMDIVMPNLDGVSATSLIRQFDPMTPIISMTSNSGPNDIMTYFSHGMNDILPKPFTKEGLLGMLEKHLIHLKVMQQMAEIPRALGFTDNQIQDALAGAVSDEGTINNPFSSMGISDHDYVEMLQGIAMEKEGKRGLEVVQGDEREGKRARFQEVSMGQQMA